MAIIGNVDSGKSTMVGHRPALTCTGAVGLLLCWARTAITHPLQLATPVPSSTSGIARLQCPGVAVHIAGLCQSNWVRSALPLCSLPTCWLLQRSPHPTTAAHLCHAGACRSEF